MRVAHTDSAVGNGSMHKISTLTHLCSPVLTSTSEDTSFFTSASTATSLAMAARAVRTTCK